MFSCNYWLCYDDYQLRWLWAVELRALVNASRAEEDLPEGTWGPSSSDVLIKSHNDVAGPVLLGYTG
jgi:hypothetical protein